MRRPNALLPVALAALTTLAACTDFPMLDAAVSEEAKIAPYPQIAPLSQLLAQADMTEIDFTTTNLAARVAALRSRAAALRALPADGA